MENEGIVLKLTYVLSFFLIFTINSISQVITVYPVWFLDPERVACSKKGIGYATLSLYKHNSVLNATNNAIENSVRMQRYSIVGGEAFSKTEAGTFAQGKSYRETYDTSNITPTKSEVIILDSAFTTNCAFVLIGDSSCPLSPEVIDKINVSSATSPDWITTLPNEKNFVYSVGIEQENYYEASSWLEAEKDARLKLARSLGVTLQELGKMSTKEGIEIQNEELSVIVENANIIRRWVDVKNNIYYVLIRSSVSQ